MLEDEIIQSINLPESVENALKLLSQYPQANINLLSSVTQKHLVDTVIFSSRGSPRKRLYLACVDSAIETVVQPLNLRSIADKNCGLRK